MSVLLEAEHCSMVRMGHAVTAFLQGGLSDCFHLLAWDYFLSLFLA